MELKSENRIFCLYRQVASHCPIELALVLMIGSTYDRVRRSTRALD
jgi:hypothetical protein